MKRSPTPKRANASVIKPPILIDVEVDGERERGLRETVEESPAHHLLAEWRGWRDCQTGSNVQVPETCLSVPSSGIGFKPEEGERRKRNRHPDPGETSRSRTLDGQPDALLGCSGEGR